MTETIYDSLIALGVQSLLTAILLLLFSRKDEFPGLLRILISALILPPLSIGIAYTTGGILREGTLLFEVIFFALLLNAVTKLRLPSAFAALFCLYGLLLGGRVYQASRITHTEAQEEQLLRQGFDEGQRGYMHDLLDARLDQRLYVIRNRVVDFFADDSTPPPPPLPTQTPAPTPLPTVQPTPLPSNVMSGEEFALLFSSEPVSEAVAIRPTPTPPPVPLPTPTATPRRALPASTSSDVINPASVGAQQLSDMAKIRNLSTDSRYPSPTFAIGLVGVGDAGTYAMVNGTVVRIGSILRTAEGSPRAWKLVHASATELHWQPVE